MRIFPSPLALPTEEWQRDTCSMQLSVVTGDEGRLSVSTSSGDDENAVHYAKSLLTIGFTNDSQTTLCNYKYIMCNCT